MIFAMDPVNMQAVHTTESTNFGAEPIRKPVNKGWMGDGIFVSVGPKWKHSRELLKPLSGKAQAQVAKLSNFDVHLERLLDLIPRDATTVDLQPLVRRLVSPILRNAA